MRKICIGILAAMVLFAGKPAHAFSLLAPTLPPPAGEYEFGVILDPTSTTEYESDDIDAEVEFERHSLVAYFAYDMFFASLGYMNEATIEDDAESSGFLAAIGLRLNIWEMDDLSATVYGQLSTEQLEKDQGAEGEWSETALLLGGVVSRQFDALKAYGGIEIIPFASTTIDGRFFGRNLSDYDEIDRANIFSLKAGASYDFETFNAGIEVQLLGVESIRLMIGKSF